MIGTGRDIYIVCVDEAPGSIVDRLVVGVDVEYGWCECTTLWQTIIFLSPSATFVV